MKFYTREPDVGSRKLALRPCKYDSEISVEKNLFAIYFSQEFEPIIAISCKYNTDFCSNQGRSQEEASSLGHKAPLGIWKRALPEDFENPEGSQN